MRIEKSVFIITFGRSGSTLLQGLLNTIDGYDIKGENYGALIPLFRSYKKVKMSRYFQGKNELDTTSPWYGADKIDCREYAQALCDIFIKCVLKPKPHAKAIGFKEIRFGSMDFQSLDESDDFLKFIREFFPNANFIFNFRNLADVSNSGWWKDSSECSDELEARKNILKFLYEKNIGYSYWVDYDEYKNEPSNLHGLWNFLGEQVDEEKIKLAMATKHSY